MGPGGADAGGHAPPPAPAPATSLFFYLGTDHLLALRQGHPKLFLQGFAQLLGCGDEKKKRGEER